MIFQLCESLWSRARHTSMLQCGRCEARSGIHRLECRARSTRTGFPLHAPARKARGGTRPRAKSQAATRGAYSAATGTSSRAPGIRGGGVPRAAIAEGAREPCVSADTPTAPVRGPHSGAGCLHRDVQGVHGHRRHPGWRHSRIARRTRRRSQGPVSEAGWCRCGRTGGRPYQRSEIVLRRPRGVTG